MPHEDQPQILLDRRDALRLGAAGAAMLAGLGGLPTARAQDCTANPAQTAGPYWVDEMLSRSDIRSDPVSGVVQQGLLLRFGISVSEVTAGVCAPLSGAYVDVWHCNALGVYSDVAAQSTLGQKFLRGYQVTDSHGTVRFLTIYPGYYPGRTVHIHFRIRKFDGNTVTFNFVSQLYFNDTVTDGIFAREAPYNTRPARATRNTNDGIYSPVMLVRLSDNTSHAIASFNVKVNSVPGLTEEEGLTPADLDDDDHADDPGGGSPPRIIQPD
jgi:protocatechuate 3,4-dioxygenase beta subunit